jgi:hypothetical protein
MAVDVARWEAHAESDIGVRIHAYLLNHPPPADSDIADRLDRIARDLQESGRLNLQSLHQRRLRAVGAG